MPDDNSEEGEGDGFDMFIDGTSPEIKRKVAAAMKSLVEDNQREAVKNLKRTAVRLGKLADAGLLTHVRMNLKDDDDNANRVVVIALSGPYPDESIDSLMSLVEAMGQDMRSEHGKTLTGSRVLREDGAIDSDGNTHPRETPDDDDDDDDDEP